MFETLLSNSPVIIGGAAALIAALLWALAAVIFRKLGENIPPIELNLVKGCLAVTMMIVTSLVLREQLPLISGLTLFLLAMSGIIGIAVGDSAYFESLNQVGPRLALLLGVLSPPLAGIISYLFLHESLRPIAWLGIVITLAGVAWVILQEQSDGMHTRKHLWRGIWFAILASSSQAIGAVISRYALLDSNISALQTAIVRLVAGIASLAILLVILKKPAFIWLRKPETIQISRGQLFGLLALGCCVGTYSAIWLQQVSLEYAPAGIAQTLLSTSPLFILPIAIIRGEKVKLKSIMGVLVAFVGVVILFGL